MNPVEATAGCVETSLANCIFNCIRAIQLILVTCHLFLKIKGDLSPESVRSLKTVEEFTMTFVASAWCVVR
jgi:hypothetical protein